MIGLFKTEVIRREVPWRGIDQVEFPTLDWVCWYNDRQLLEPVGYVPPVEIEENVLSQPNCSRRDGGSQLEHSAGKPGRFSPRIAARSGRFAESTSTPSPGVSVRLRK